MASRKPARPAAPGQTRTAGARDGQAGRAQQQGGQGARAKDGRPGRGGTNGATATRVRAGQPGPGTGAARAGTNKTGPADARSATAKTAVYVPPLWVQLAALVLSVAALGVSVYLTIAHYTSTSILACSDNGLVNCAKVTTSSQSMVFGVFPVAVLGLAFYIFMTAINTPWAWRWQQPVIPWLRTIGAITGIGFVVYLIYAEVVQIGNICLWCTVVHCITFLLFVLLLSVAPFIMKPAASR